MLLVEDKRADEGMEEEEGMLDALEDDAEEDVFVFCIWLERLEADAERAVALYQ